MANSDKAWEYFGREQPYYGVLTKQQFEGTTLDSDARNAFFATGENYVSYVLDTVHRQLDPSFVPHRVLDFGCGVGRLTLPLARRADEAVGVDVSESMLREARENARLAGQSNVEFVQGDDELSKVTGRFDLVHSFIVFQHIPRDRGETILRKLLDRLDEGGVGIIHMTYANSASTPSWRRAMNTAYARVPFLYNLRNLAKRDPVGHPQMEMNLYDLSSVMRMLQENGCHDIHVRFTEASFYRYPIYGAILHFSKKTLDVTSHS